MIYAKCAKCGEEFERDGLSVTLHGRPVGAVCPACVAGVDRIHLIVSREGAGHPYQIGYIETTKEGLPGK